MSDIIVHDSNRICILELTLDPGIDSDLIQWLAQPDTLATLRHAKRAAELVIILKEIMRQGKGNTALATLEALATALRYGSAPVDVAVEIEVSDAEPDDDPVLAGLAELRAMVLGLTESLK